MYPGDHKWQQFRIPKIAGFVNDLSRLNIFLMNAVWDRYLNITFAIFLVNFDGSSRLLTDVWPNAKPCAIDFDEFGEINEFFKFICNFH